MITGELRSQIARSWDAFWAGGLSNPPALSIDSATCQNVRRGCFKIRWT